MVIHVRYRPGRFLVQGHAYATVWPAEAAVGVARETGPRTCHRTVPDPRPGCLLRRRPELVEIAIRALSPAVNDTFTALTCIHWIGDSLCKVTGQWHLIRVYPDGDGAVQLVAAEATYERLVQRAFEKIRQAGRGMPAVMIRQLDTLAKIMERATAAKDRQLLLDQAAMIDRLSLSSVEEESDRADIDRAYQSVLRVHAALPESQVAPRGGGRGAPAAQASQHWNR